MDIIVKDNFIDQVLIDTLEHEFLFQIPHWFGHSSNLKDNMFYATNMGKDEIIIQYILQKIKTEIIEEGELYELSRSYFNIQHPGMDGNFHLDDGNLTALLMVTKDPDSGGEFEYIENNVPKSIPYKQNRLIVFDTKIKHRGKAYNEYPRITLALKLKKQNNEA